MNGKRSGHAWRGWEWSAAAPGMWTWTRASLASFSETYYTSGYIHGFGVGNVVVGGLQPGRAGAGSIPSSEA